MHLWVALHGERSTMSQSHPEFGHVQQRVSQVPDGEYRELPGSSRRRHLFDVLDAREAVVGLETVAEAVAEREPTSSTTPDVVEEIAITLHHNHLPKLADAGIIEYEPEAHAIHP